MRGPLVVGILGGLVLLGAVGSARAADKWFVLGHTTLKATDPSAAITGEEGKVLKEDIKKTKLAVSGGDVDVSKVVLHWNNRPDETVTNVGVIRMEETAADAPDEATRRSRTRSR